MGRFAWDIWLTYTVVPTLKTFEHGVLGLGTQTATIMLSMHLPYGRSSNLKGGGRLSSLETRSLPSSIGNGIPKDMLALSSAFCE